jgi:hypothetical protein
MGKRLKKLQPPDSLHLNAAEGWLGLGDTAAAMAELDNIAPAIRTHPDVLEVRWQIFAKANRWNACIDIASVMTKLVPKKAEAWIHLAYSIRQARGGVEDSIPVLTSVVDKFPKDPLICYYLACYTAQTSRLTESTSWWDKAMTIAGKYGFLKKNPADGAGRSGLGTVA